MTMRRWTILVLAVLLSACQRAPRTGLDFPRQPPDRLSDWHIVERKDGQLVLNKGVVPYDLNSALFSDYAHKLRTVLLPEHTSIRYGDDDFAFPVGTVITKTFYYPRAATPAADTHTIAVAKVPQQSEAETLDLAKVRLLETRLLINTADGWVALPYVWNEEQTEATLSLAGETLSLELVDGDARVPFTYMVPDTNQCAGCHALEHHDQKLKPIGVKARHLNKPYDYAQGSDNQLAHWQTLGLLSDAPSPNEAPRNSRWDDPTDGTIDSRARAYLDVNCGHCHRPGGAANTSGLLLHAQEAEAVHLGICKIPIATGRGSGDELFDIVPGAPRESILLHRMESTEADVAMPEVGRALVHQEGVRLIGEWIASLPGSCAASR